MKSEWAPFDDREFDCHLYEWVDEHVGGRIWPADWKAARLRGVVPIRVCEMGGRLTLKPSKSIILGYIPSRIPPLNWGFLGSLIAMASSPSIGTVPFRRS